MDKKSKMTSRATKNRTANISKSSPKYKSDKTKTKSIDLEARQRAATDKQSKNATSSSKAADRKPASPTHQSYKKAGDIPTPRGRIPKVKNAKLMTPGGNNTTGNAKGPGSSKSTPMEFEIDSKSGRILTVNRSCLQKIDKKSTGVVSSVHTENGNEKGENIQDLEKDVDATVSKNSGNAVSRETVQKVHTAMSSEMAGTTNRTKKQSIDLQTSREPGKISKMIQQASSTQNQTDPSLSERTRRLRSVSQTSMEEIDIGGGVIHKMHLYEELEYQRQSHQELSRQHIEIDTKISEICENNEAEMKQIVYKRRLLKFDNQSILNKLERMDQEIFTYYNKRVELHNAEQVLRARATKAPFADYKLEKLHHKKRKWSEEYAKKDAIIRMIEDQLLEKTTILQQQRELLERVANPKTLKQRFQNFRRKFKIFFGNDNFSPAML